MTVTATTKTWNLALCGLPFAGVLLKSQTSKTVTLSYDFEALRLSKGSFQHNLRTEVDAMRCLVYTVLL